jgi:hypothetical protein
MKLPELHLSSGGKLRSGITSGFTLVEIMVACGIFVVTVGGALTFFNLANTSISGITTQSRMSSQAGGALECLQRRARFATSVSNSPSGNTLTLGFDDNTAVDSDGDGKPYNDKDHFEQFKFVGTNSTSSTACVGNSFVYIPNITATNQHVLISRGVRNLPAYKIFTLTNEVMTVVRFGIVDGNSRDGYQAIDIQGTALSLNRPSTVNIISILP